jgi:SAM-dependent methyltransferase
MVAPDRIRDDNVRYHDLAAAHYDTKWGISYGPQGQAQVVGKLAKALGRSPEGFSRGLEIGAGTGYFSLNLLRAGVLDEAVATDISPGMLEILDESASRLSLPVTTAVCEAGELPFEDDSFDLVFGHAVLHHLPDLEGSFAEFARVLRPGGTLFFAGEPSEQGDRIAAWPKRAAMRAAPAWRRLVRARPVVYGSANGGSPHPDHAEHALESVVDVHAFDPGDLERLMRGAGLVDARVRGEELLANWFGWFNRTVEASAIHDDIPMLWFQFAFRGYLGLQKVDRALLEPRLPPQVFYNLMIAARRP